MSRVQLALNVSNLGEAVEFYSKYFQTPPAKVRDGYANFALLDPPLKLVLIENGGAPGSLNHLGVEVFSSAEVAQAARRFASDGFATDVESNTTCCHAVQDKVWVHGPDTMSWETYVVLDDAPPASSDSSDDGCCVTIPAAVGGVAARCC